MIIGTIILCALLIIGVDSFWRWEANRHLWLVGSRYPALRELIGKYWPERVYFEKFPADGLLAEKSSRNEILDYSGSCGTEHHYDSVLYYLIKPCARRDSRIIPVPIGIEVRQCILDNPGKRPAFVVRVEHYEPAFGTETAKMTVIDL